MSEPATTLFKDDWAARSSGGPRPMRCAGPKGRATGPFGNEGHHRCPNTATRHVRPISPNGYRMQSLALCIDHTPEGRFGMDTPTNWRWEWESRASR